MLSDGCSRPQLTSESRTLYKSTQRERETYIDIAEMASQYSQWLNVICTPDPSCSVMRSRHKVETLRTEYKKLFFGDTTCIT